MTRVIKGILNDLTLAVHKIEEETNKNYKALKGWKEQGNKGKRWQNQTQKQSNATQKRNNFFCDQNFLMARISYLFSLHPKFTRFSKFTHPF